MNRIRIASLCIILSIHCNPLFAQEVSRITVNSHSRPISQVLKEIEKQSGMAFVYSEDELDPSTPVTVLAIEQPVFLVMEKLFRPLGLNYTIKGKTVYLSRPVTVITVQETAELIPPDVANATDSADEKSGTLEELVSIGYGVRKRSDVTGAISTVKAEELDRMPTASIAQMLRGTAAGVQAYLDSAEPGGSCSLFIRGRHSFIAGNSPLYIVDGVPVAEIDDINAFDIESVEILKDASSQAIYGARAANGVILIKTKRGEVGKVKISYNGYLAVQDKYRNCEFYNGEEWAAYRKEAYIQAFGTYDQARCFPGVMSEVLRSGGSVDWEELIMRNAFQQKHDISVQGGNESTLYAFSLGAYQQDGLVIDSGFDKVSLRCNIDHRISDNLKIGANLSYAQSRQQTADGTFNTFITTPPLAKVYEDDGHTLREDVTGAGESHCNPLWSIRNSQILTEAIARLCNVFGDWNIVDGLFYRLNAGMVDRNVESGCQGKARESLSTEKEYLIENILNYKKDFNSVHHFDATLMQSYTATDYNFLGVDGTVPSCVHSEAKMLSFLARVGYNYENRYLFSAAVRADASSVFAPTHGLGFFPSASFAWRINKEGFLKQCDWISNLKLRLSWGQAGNQGTKIYLPNPDLKWETSTSVNLGLDFGFWRDRLSGSFEMYSTDTDDLLVKKPSITATGDANQYVNMGAVQNKGVELTIKTVPVKVNGFSWALNLTCSANMNRIVRLDNNPDPNTTLAVGEPMNVYCDYAFDGIWQIGDEIAASCMPDAKPGDIRVKDIVADNTINPDDKVFYKRDPDWIGAIYSSFGYKGIDLSFDLYASVGGYIFNEYLTSYDSGGDMTGRKNGLRRNYWTVNNPSNEAPAPNMARTPAYIICLGYQDASYVRLRNIRIGYTLPKRMTEACSVQSLRIYATFANVWTWTDVLGYGPEGNAGAYPEPRTALLGVSLTF